MEINAVYTQGPSPPSFPGELNGRLTAGPLLRAGRTWEIARDDAPPHVLEQHLTQGPLAGVSRSSFGAVPLGGLALGRPGPRGPSTAPPAPRLYLRCTSASVRSMKILGGAPGFVGEVPESDSLPSKCIRPHVLGAGLPTMNRTQLCLPAGLRSLGCVRDRQRAREPRLPHPKSYSRLSPRQQNCGREGWACLLRKGWK